MKSLSTNPSAEVKPSGPIRTSLYEREGSMWGRLKRPSPRHFSLPDECRSDDSYFCREVVAKGYLTEEQMHRAAARYQLGKSRSGKTIYWLIDESGVCRDGHIGSSWVSEMLRHRFPDLAQYVRARHCLFGLHLLNSSYPTGASHLNGSPPTGGVLAKASVPAGRARGDLSPVSIVESEASAVILSELQPEFTWMAVANIRGFSIEMLEPLKGRKVVVYPDTDDTMSNYVTWLDLAELARHSFHLDISVSNILEKHATVEQKKRKIDLIDFLFSTHRPP